jgi:hypothetical protein
MSIVLRKRQAAVGMVLPAALAALFLFSACKSGRAVDATPEQAAAYLKLAPQVDQAALWRHIEYMASLGSRVTGYPACDKAANYIIEHLRALNLRDVDVETFPLSVPVVKEATIQVSGTQYNWPLYPMWPNAVRTSQLRPGGIETRVVYGGDGQLTELSGKDISGSTVMLDFRCGSRWLNAFRLGAKAVIFIEPDSPADRGEAEPKYLSLPLNAPRFWMGRAEATTLLGMLESRPQVKARLKCRMVWERRWGKNILATLPGTDPKLKKETVYITAYYDSMSVVPQLAPGAESACGIAAMLEMARILTLNPPKRTVVFLATAGHFEALTGIRSYFGDHLREMETGTWRHKRARFLGLIPYTHDWRERKTINLLTALDLSSRTKRVGIFYKGWYYNYREDRQREFSDIAREYRENGEKIAKVLGVPTEDAVADGVNPIAGKPWRTFIPGKIALENEPFTLGGGRGVAFVTTDDLRNYVDTPSDIAQYVDVKNLRDQVRFLACEYREILNDPKIHVDTEPRFQSMSLNGGFATLAGRVVEFDPRKGIIPQKAIPGSLVIVRPGDWEGAQTGKVFRQAFMGVRGDMAIQVDKSGWFAFYGVPTINAYGWRKATYLEAFHTDPVTGDVDYAPDLGSQGAKQFSIEVFMTMGRKEATIVVFPCVSIAIFDIVDPQVMVTLPNIHLYDAYTDAEPRSFGYSIPRPEFGVSYVEDVALVYAKRGTRIKITMELGPAARRFLLLNSTKKRPEGIGFLAERSSTIANTPYQVAHDMWTLDEFRIQRLAKYRIVNNYLDTLHADAASKLKDAAHELKKRNYAAFSSHARAAWGYESRAYPDVQATTDDVVKSSLFYLALMLPFAFFLERLLFAMPNLKLQIAVATLLFIACFAVFRYIHPAFDITMNPLIVLLAFIMLTLSVLVIALVVSKFENQLKALQMKLGGIHRADIGRISVAAAAFNLGISNMRRRKARTFLTTITLVLVTFTVLSFTSVVSYTRYNERRSPGRPLYNGLMVRSAIWGPLEESAYRILDNEFGKTRAVVPRAWFATSLSDEQSFIKLTSNKSEKSYNVRAAVGMAAGEPKVTKIDRALMPGSRWFKPGERYACVIPSAVATTFDISPADIGRAKIQFAGLSLDVIGIASTPRIRGIRDLDHEWVTPVDFIQMQKMQRAGQGQQAEAGFQEYIHLSPDDIIFIPYDLAISLGSKLESVGIEFTTPAEVRKVLRELMPRLGFNLYAGMANKIWRWSAMASTTVTGLADLFVPLLIAALIILNTMLGAVHERVREIGIFSSVGLAPSHIALLFMAEAFVYAILGAVFGYLVGQGAAKIITEAHLLKGLFLNYSSVSAVSSTFIVIAVVMLSTIYPARKASEVATPAIERRWRVPEPAGDDWHIPLPFAVTGEQAHALTAFMLEWFNAYEEYSIGDFVTQDVQAAEVETPAGKGQAIKLMAWLAPFDLGVSQHVELVTQPTEMHDVFEINLNLHRESGDVSSWKRVNRRFLNTLRKQFLIWRTLRAEDRERYLAGRSAEGGAPEPAPAS